MQNRPSYPTLKGSHKADWLIIGAGFTGLSAAHQLAERRPNDKVIVLDAQGIAEGASARNSGFIVDSTLNDGQAGHSAEKAYLLKYQLNTLGTTRLKAQVSRFGIQCDWDEAGKYHAAVSPKFIPKLEAFSSFLDGLNISNQLLDTKALQQRLGISHYRAAVFTKGGRAGESRRAFIRLSAGLERIIDVWRGGNALSTFSCGLDRSIAGTDREMREWRSAREKYYRCGQCLYAESGL